MELINITAAVTTYKRSWSQIERAITSILNQTVPVNEILLVDDNEEGSKYSMELKEKLENIPHISYITAGRNQGVSEARNLAIRAARGDWIGFLDDDDEWTPDKVEVFTELINKHPDAGMVFGLGYIEDDQTKQKEVTWQATVFQKNPSYEDLLEHDCVGSASIPFMRTDMLRELGGFKVQPAVEDYELWVRIAKEYPVYGTMDTVYLKHMEAGEHVSTNHQNTFIGYKCIYEANEEAYAKNDRARKWIYYNIMREGIKARTPKVIPYCFKWAALRIMTGRR